MVVRMKCEGKWILLLYFRSVTFVVLPADQKVGALMARSNNRGRIAILARKSHISSDFKEKSESLLQRRQSLM